VDILLLEYNAALHANLVEQLEGAGHRVNLAVDGETGLNLALSQPHDVLVLDLGLPRLDGLDVCRRLRERRGREPLILMLTARDTLEDKARGLCGGS
jgi:DNA-binding response OmpR family regulator